MISNQTEPSPLYVPGKETKAVFSEGMKPIKVPFLGVQYDCDFAFENTPEFGDWVVLKARGRKPIDVTGGPATAIIDYLYRALNGTTNRAPDLGAYR